MLSRSYLDGLLERLPRGGEVVGVRDLFAKRNFLNMQARARKNKRGSYTRKPYLITRLGITYIILTYHVTDFHIHYHLLAH